MTFLRWLSTFFALLLLTALLLGGGLAWSIHLARRPDFARIVGDASIPVQEEAFTDRGRQCDILIYGDSTASIGIDPRVLQAQLKLSACNIAVTRPIVDDLGTLPLDEFLAHNSRPKYLIFQFGPELLYRNNAPWERNGPYAPMVMLSRNVATAQAVPIMLRHPAEVVQFVLFMVQGAIRPRAKLDSDELYRKKMDVYSNSGGLLTLFLPAQTTCKSPALKLYGPPDATWVKELRRRYQSQGTTVLFRGSPVPSCDPQLQMFQHDLEPILDGNVESLPIGLFTAGDRHPTLEGAQEDSLGLVRLIAAHR